MKSQRRHRPESIEILFPARDEKMTREERLKKIKRVVNREDFITEEKLERAIEKLIDYVILS